MRYQQCQIIAQKLPKVTDFQSLQFGVAPFFDAFLIGLTATPSKQTIGFFGQNLVMEYNHEQAVADGVNVDFDVYTIPTQISVIAISSVRRLNRRKPYVPILSRKPTAMWAAAIRKAAASL